jgi:hypothetical protein
MPGLAFHTLSNCAVLRTCVFEVAVAAPTFSTSIHSSDGVNFSMYNMFVCVAQSRTKALIKLDVNPYPARRTEHIGRENAFFLWPPSGR